MKDHNLDSEIVNGWLPDVHLKFFVWLVVVSVTVTTEAVDIDVVVIVAETKEPVKLCEVITAKRPTERTICVFSSKGDEGDGSLKQVGSSNKVKFED